MPYGGNPAASPSDELRFLIGDISLITPVLTDGEVSYLTAMYSSGESAAVACEALAGRFAEEVDRSIGQLKISASKKFDHYIALAADIRMRYGYRAIPWIGGQSVSEKLATTSILDRVQPSFVANDPYLVGGRNASTNTI